MKGLLEDYYLVRIYKPLRSREYIQSYRISFKMADLEHSKYEFPVFIGKNR